MARRKLMETRPSVKMLILGKEGTRKSNTAIQLSMLKNKLGKDMKVLLIDTEFKSIEGFSESFIVERGVNPDNILEIRTRDMELINELSKKFAQGDAIPEIVIKSKDVIDPVSRKKNQVKFETFGDNFEVDAENNPFVADVIIIDSLSVISDLLEDGRQELATLKLEAKIREEGLTGLDALKARDGVGLQFLDRAKIKKLALEFVRRLLATTDKHIVFIARAKDAKETIKQNGKMEILDLGYEILDATAFKFINYEVNTILHCYKDKIVVEKDGSTVFTQGEELSNFEIDKFNKIMLSDKSGTVEVVSQEDAVQSSIDLSNKEKYTKEEILYSSIINKIESSDVNKVKIKEVLTNKKIAWGDLQKQDAITLSSILKELK